MPSDAPLVSVIIPVHNRAGLIERAVRSVLIQSMEDLEVIVVDDASADGTADVVRGIADRRTHVIELHQNRGPGGARNEGLEHARGRYVAFLDSDDEWLPTKLAAQLARLAEDDAAAVCYCPYLIGLGDRAAPHAIPLPEGDVWEALVSGWHPPLMSSVVVRRDALGTSRFDVDLATIEDLDMWFELGRRTKFVAVSEPKVILDKSPAPDRGTLDIAQRLAVIRRFREKWLARIEDPSQRATLEASCEGLELIARLTAGWPGSLRERLELARRALNTEMPPRTRAAGLIRLAFGPRFAARVQRGWFLLAGRPRAEVRGSP